MYTTMAAGMKYIFPVTSESHRFQTNSVRLFPNRRIPIWASWSPTSTASIQPTQKSTEGNFYNTHHGGNSLDHLLVDTIKERSRVRKCSTHKFGSTNGQCPTSIGIQVDGSFVPILLTFTIPKFTINDCCCSTGHLPNWMKNEDTEKTAILHSACCEGLGLLDPPTPRAFAMRPSLPCEARLHLLVLCLKG